MKIPGTRCSDWERKFHKKILADQRGFFYGNCFDLFRNEVIESVPSITSCYGKSVVLRAELADHGTGLPHLALTQGSQLLLKTLTIAGL